MRYESWLKYCVVIKSKLMDSLVENDIAVISNFGYWPEFCDAKIISFSFERIKERKNIQIGLFYIDSDKSISSQIKIAFEEVFQVRLTDFLDENVLDEIIIDKDIQSGFISVKLTACSGLAGSFNCRSVKVL